MNEFEIKVNYRKRTRRATLRVLPGKIIRVTAPFRARASDIKEFIQKNEEWILKRYKIIEANPPPKSLQFIEGEKFRFKGLEYKLEIKSGRGEILLTEDTLQVFVPIKIADQKKYLQRKLVQWYQARALEYITPRVQFYCHLINAKEKSIALKNYKSRWGCCSAKGDLIFNWQIVSFSENLIDYVVAHEVCHLKEMNHSVRFYNWLRQLGFEKNTYHFLMRSAQNLFVR